MSDDEEIAREIVKKHDLFAIFSPRRGLLAVRAAVKAGRRSEKAKVKKKWEGFATKGIELNKDCEDEWSGENTFRLFDDWINNRKPR